MTLLQEAWLKRLIKSVLATSFCESFESDNLVTSWALTELPIQCAVKFSICFGCVAPEMAHVLYLKVAGHGPSVLDLRILINPNMGGKVRYNWIETNHSLMLSC